jgi:hypothetical protein
MASHVIWNCIEALSAALDGDRQGIEIHLNQLERELLQMSQARRAEIRGMLIVIVAGLSRLELRMKEAERG